MENKKRNYPILSVIMKGICSITLVCLLLSYLAPYFHPNTITILPFFGLAYPIFAIATFCFGLFWAVFRSKWAIICLFVLLIGGKLHFRTFAFQLFPGEKAPENALSILSYNVRLFGVYDDNSLKNRNAIFAYLRAENPDVACFQEYYKQDKPTKFETIDSLSQALKSIDYHERTAHKIKGRKNFGVAMFSKYPMIARGDVIFESQEKDDFNFCIFVDIVKNKDTFRIYNVHLQSIKLKSTMSSIDENNNDLDKKSILTMIKKLKVAYTKRADQSRRIIAHMNASPYPSVICGDFNDTPMSYTYNQFDRFLIDVFRNSSWGIGRTYIGKLPAGRIDYIFHTPNLSSADFKIQKEKLSDHLAISCKIYKP
jgi:endonuclease/exonuclease/phosphatase family metal-dependent hydrolase